MKHSEQVNELFAALSKFQGELDNAIKCSAGHGYKYADLAECINVAKAPLAANGLSVVQMIGQSSEHQTLITMLCHSSGQYLQSEFIMVNATLMGGAGKNPAQVLGSAITYQRRYAYTAILGMAQEDDDAAVCAPSKQVKVKQTAYIRAKLRRTIQDKGYTEQDIQAHWNCNFDDYSDAELNATIKQIESWDNRQTAVKENKPKFNLRSEISRATDMDHNGNMKY